MTVRQCARRSLECTRHWSNSPSFVSSAICLARNEGDVRRRYCRSTSGKRLADRAAARAPSGAASVDFPKVLVKSTEGARQTEQGMTQIDRHGMCCIICERSMLQNRFVPFRFVLLRFLYRRTSLLSRRELRIPGRCAKRDFETISRVVSVHKTKKDCHLSLCFASSFVSRTDAYQMSRPCTFSCQLGHKVRLAVRRL